MLIVLGVRNNLYICQTKERRILHNQESNKMKEYLAKLILGKDVRKELATAEQEKLNEIVKLERICSNVAALETQRNTLANCIDTKKRELSELQEEKRGLDEIFSQVEIGENEDVLTFLQTKLTEKNGVLDTLKQDLSALESQRDQLKTRIPVLLQEKQGLQSEVDVLKEQIEEKKRNERQLVNKLEQSKVIRDNLNNLKEQWHKKMNDFETRIDDADRHALLQLQRELKDYEIRITNAINTPIV